MKKFIMMSVLSLAILVTSGAQVFAYSNTTSEHEPTIINGSYVVVGEYATRGVISEYVYDSDGNKAGYWIHGKKKISDEKKIYSKFKAYSPYDYGRASVVNGEGDVYDGGWQLAGTYSVAYEKWTFWGTNKAFYDYK